MINLDGISMTKEDIDGFNKVYIVACGTAYHAGLVGKHAIEKMARIPVEVDVASEFRYRDPFVDEKTLFIAISQSGETLKKHTGFFLILMREEILSCRSVRQ